VGRPAQALRSDLALVQEFWDAVSTRIQNWHDIFELWNEPVYEEDELSPSDPDGSR
jgi:Cellulase (glycosyl hydrolase family 5)